MPRSLIVLCLLCVASCGGPAKPTAAADDDARTIDDWIADLDRPRLTPKAAAKLAEMAEREGAERALAPLISAWKRDQSEPVILEAVVKIAAQAPGGPRWKPVLPTLRTAVSEVAASDNRSLKSALIAVEALASVRDYPVLPALIKLAKRSVPDLAPAHRLRLVVVAALGRYGKHDLSVAALVSLLKREPTHRVQVMPAAAALALAQTRSEKAIVPLLQAIVRIPNVYPQCRRALATIGKPVIPVLIDMLRGRQTDVKDLAAALELNVRCSQRMGLGTTCPQPSILEYRAAALLGDLRATSAVGALIEAAGEPPLPAYFGRSGPGQDQHVAILRALGQVGDERAAKVLWAYATDAARKPANRAVAIAGYSHLVSDAEALPVLAQIMADDTQPSELRTAAAEGYGLMVRDNAPMQPLLGALEGEEQPREGKVLIEPFKRVARAHAGAACKVDPKCYVELVAADTDELAKDLRAHVPTIDKWDKEHRQTMADATRARALLELAKLGAQARSVIDRLLALTDTANGDLRRAALDAMARVAELPCDACGERLDAIIAADREDSARTGLVVDTQIVRDYFAWAGR